MRALVTGGAGFIGSHLVDALMERGMEVRVLDNLSAGRMENLRRWENHPSFSFVRGDCLREEDLERALEGCELVFHLAANPEVRLGAEDPTVIFEQNVIATQKLLEAMRKLGVRQLVFTSSSTVYGDAEILPTPEDAPLKPISIYGATKLACESLISSYAHTFDFKAVSYRFANIVGARSRHGVIWDFIQKLRRNPRELEILGDGTQRKSYMHVRECVEAMLFGWEHAREGFEVYNLGSKDQVSVREIAEMVIKALGLKDVKLKFTGGVKGGRGWPGDVKVMLLDVSKLESLGWKPRQGSRGAVEQAIKELLAEEFHAPS
ncbi:MAG: NAD-dependent epimerase/dehydratase family protein [Candidatus Hadarchaeales archaeon]